MGKYQEQPRINVETEKSQDRLPDGTEQEYYLKKNKEWPKLDRRLGKPRMLKNIYFSEVFKWIQSIHKDNPDDFSYFEAGCGHGNDLRAIKEKLEGRGRFFGVDMSEAEIKHGLEFYHGQEDMEESKKIFAQGDVRDLRHINIWDKDKGDFSQPSAVGDGEFDLVYFEAILHGLGYGKDTYQEKKDSAQRMLNELYRICKPGGRFFGRASTFGPSITKEQQFELLRETNNWRFIPGAEEFERMLKQAGFINIKKTLDRHEKVEENPDKRNILRFSFLAEK